MMAQQFRVNNIAQSVFQKNYEQLPESQKELLNDKYNCSICYEIIKHENPFLCYECQKIFHHACLKGWDTRLKQLNKNLTCPICRNKLPFEQWKVFLNYDEERTKAAEILNQAGKSFDFNEYTEKTINLFQVVLNKLNDMHPLIENQKNYKLFNLVEEFKSRLMFPSLDEISSVIIEELDLLKEYIENSKKGIINEGVNHKNEINLKYMAKNDGMQNIFHEYFVANNASNISLVINQKRSPLVNKYNLKQGENDVTICINKKLTNLSYMFYFCKSLYNIEELKYLNTEDVTDFSFMFGNSEISDIKPLEKWITNKSETFCNMFSCCKSLTNINALKSWNVSNCKNFSGMFDKCENLTNIKALECWNVSNGEDFSFLFRLCYLLSDIKSLENWNVSNGINFECMLTACDSLIDIMPLGNWNVSKGRNFGNCFRSSRSLSDIKPLEKWNVSNAICLNGIFAGIENLTDIKALEKWNVSRCLTFEDLFFSCKNLSDITPLQNWNVSKGTDFSNMFHDCKKITSIKPLEKWNVSNGNKFYAMFSNCEGISDLTPLKNWNVSSGTNFSFMFCI